MDGVRAYWNGTKMLSRHGKTIPCPQWFTRDLQTDIHLDGELWLGPGSSHTQILNVTNSKASEWTSIGYYVYDVPCVSGTYEDRMEYMDSIELPTHVHIVKNIRCKGTDHLKEYLDSIVANQGEGIVLRKPNTAYEIGYTSSVVKVKVVSRTNSN